MFTCFYKGNYIQFPQNVIIATPTLKKPDNCYTNFENLGIFEVVHRFVRENPDLRCDFIPVPPLTTTTSMTTTAS